MAQVVVKAEAGREIGSSSVRRLRKEGHFPAVVYGKDQEATSLTCDSREFRLALSGRIAAGAVLTLSFSGTKKLVRVQEVQRHPVKREVTHVDFHVLGQSEIVVTSIPILVEEDGIEVVAQALEIVGPASSLPSVIEIKKSQIDPENGLLAKDLKLPRGISLVSDSELLIARLSDEG